MDINMGSTVEDSTNSRPDFTELTNQQNVGGCGSSNSNYNGYENDSSDFDDSERVIIESTNFEEHANSDLERKKNMTEMESDEGLDHDDEINELLNQLSDDSFSEQQIDDSLKENSVNMGDSENMLKSNENDTSKEEGDIKKPSKILQLPLGRVKRIMKSDPEVTIVSSESVFLIAKATELFLKWLGKEIYSNTVRQKKKTVQKRDLDLAIEEIPALEFLDVVTTGKTSTTVFRERTAYELRLLD